MGSAEPGRQTYRGGGGEEGRTGDASPPRGGYAPEADTKQDSSR